MDDDRRVEGKKWVKKAKKVTVPLALELLALNTIGVSIDQLQTIYGLDRSEVEKGLLEGIRSGKTSKLKRLNKDNDRFMESKFGIDELEELLNQSNNYPNNRNCNQFDIDSYEFNWELTEEFANRPLYTLRSSRDINEFLNKFKEIFFERSKLELLILLPQPSEGSVYRWDILKTQYEVSEQNSALKLLSCLSILGLSHNNKNRKTLKYLSNLVTSSQGLSEQVAVCGTQETDSTSPENNHILREQIKLFIKNVLILKPLRDDVGDEVKPFALNFINAWQYKDTCYSDFHLRDRFHDLENIADALLLLMTNTSGVLCHISLQPRKQCNKLKSLDVQIIAPTQFNEFLEQSLRPEHFEPYKLLDDDAVPLLRLNQPIRFKEFKVKRRKS